MATLDLTATRTDLVFAVDNDKVLTAGPFTQSGAVLTTASKSLRFVMKASETTADGSATLDFDSVADPTKVYTVGVAALGVWAIDLRDSLTTVGQFWYRVDLTASSSLNTDRQIVAQGTLTVKAV